MTAPMPGAATRGKARQRTRARSARSWWRTPGGRRARLVIVAVAAAVLAGAGLFSYQAYSAARDLQELGDRATRVLTAAVRGDDLTARSGAQRLADDVAAHRRRSAQVHWAAAARLPFVGDDIEVLRGAITVADKLARRVLVPAVELGGVYGPSEVLPRNGRFDLAVLEGLGADLRPLVDEAHAAAREAALLEEGNLARTARERVESEVASVATALESLSDGLALAPDVLGRNGLRRYVVIFQNNAELRATGGIPGSMAVLEAQNGRVTMVQQGSTDDFGDHRADPVPLSAQERALFGARMGQFSQNATFTPHFPRTGEIVADMWRRTSGQRVDGVASVDPVGMGAVLAGTDPVPLSNGIALGSDNAVDILLNAVYLMLGDREEQNQVFEGAARGSFDALMGGSTDPAAVLAGVIRAGEEHRIFGWLRRPGEQQFLAGLPLGGVVAEEDDGSPTVGVFLNDATQTKLDYYVEHIVDVDSIGCRPDGVQELEVSLRIRSRVPEDGTVLPPSVLGGSPDGTVRTTVLAYGPAGGSFVDSTLDDAPGAPAAYAHRNHPVSARTFDLAPGQTRTARWRVLSAPGQREAPRLRTTPGARFDGRGTVSGTSCD